MIVSHVGMCFETKPRDFSKFCNTSSYLLITNLISYSFRNVVSMIEILNYRQIISENVICVLTASRSYTKIDFNMCSSVVLKQVRIYLFTALTNSIIG